MLSVSYTDVHEMFDLYQKLGMVRIEAIIKEFIQGKGIDYLLCKVCKKQIETGAVLCNDCETFVHYTRVKQLALKFWRKACQNEHEYDAGAKQFVRNIDGVDFGAPANINVLNSIKQSLEKEIENLILFYSKEDIMAAGMIIKEASRRMMLKEKHYDSWWVNTEFYAACKLLEMTISLDEKLFENYDLSVTDEFGFSSLVSIIVLLRVYAIIENNCMTMKYINKQVTLEKAVFEHQETKEMFEYFEWFKNLGIHDKPEDYSFINEELRKKVEIEGKTPSERRKSLDKQAKHVLGFTLDNLLKFSSIVGHIEFITPDDFLEYSSKKTIFTNDRTDLIIMSKNTFYEIFSEFEKNELENIMNFFSLTNVNIRSDFVENKSVELYSVIVEEGAYVFGLFDLIQNISIFEKLINSGHFIELYGIDKNKMKISKNQNNLSTYFSYIIADKLESCGYKLPEKNIKINGRTISLPVVDIDKIKVQDTNILVNIGDIDVLAISEKEKTVLNIEFKDFKPAMTARDLFYIDEDKIEGKKVIEKILVRENIIKENIYDIVEFILGYNVEGYKVRSILISTRPNYYGYIQEKIEYHDLTRFFDLIDLDYKE